MEQHNNLFNNNEVRELINRSQLSYVKEEGEGNPVSEVIDSSISRKQQYVSNKDSALSRAINSKKHMFNVQISYDVNKTLNLKSWDGNFHAIFLYGLMEHLASDMKHIKELLCQIQKYILNKSIKSDKANNVKNLDGIGKAAWGFISALYESH